MQTPELLLPALNDALRELRAAVGILNDNSIDAGLLPIMRSLMLAEVLGNKSIIAVGGSQGAGKTNLICTMYNLNAHDNSDWLQSNEGQGERYPVLIQEVDLKEGESEIKPQGYLCKLILSESEGTYKLDTKSVDIKEFRSACRGEISEVMLPILEVPRNFFQRSDHALILLPGYETSTRENQVWQALMQQVLIGAAGCVIVTDQTRLANQQQRDIVEVMLSNELRSSRPIVVVSKTEGIANFPDQLETLKKTAANLFKINDQLLESTVICTGSNNPDYVKNWMPELKAGLKNMSIGGGELRQMQFVRLEKLLNDDLKKITNLITTRSVLFLQGKNGGHEGPQALVKNFLEEYDDAANDLRNEYHTAIENMLTSHFTKANEKLTGRLITEHEGILNKVVNILDTVSETQRTMESTVKSSWDDAGDVLPQFAELLDKLTHRKLRGSTQPCLTTLSSGHTLHRLGYMDSKNDHIKSKFTDPAVQANLAVLLKGKGGSNKEMEKTIQLLPIMALEYARIASILPELVGVNPNTLETIPQIDILESVQKVQTEFEQFKDISTSIVKGLGAMLAIDIVADNTIPSLLSALGLGSVSTAATASTDSTTSATAGAAISGTAATVALSVTAVIAIGFLAHSALRQVRHHDTNVSIMAKTMLQKIKDQHVHHFVWHFDDLIGKLRKHLQESLRQRYQLDRTLMEQDRLTKALADIRVLQDDFLRELARSGKTLQLFGGRAA